MARTHDDLREIPKIERWEDITGRPNYSLEIDGSKDSLQGVLAPYQLAPLKPCGLKNCRTPNGKGYLIRATDGRETNIGANCGKKHFPEHRAEFLRIDRIVREREIRARAAAAKLDAARIRSLVDHLRKQDQGADWVRRCVDGLKKLMIKVDPPAWTDLQRRAATGRIVVNESRRIARPKGGPEIRIDAKGQTRAVMQDQFEDVRIGSFTGLGVFTPGRDLRVLLIERVDHVAKGLQDCDPDRDGYKPLNKLLQGYGEIDTTLQQAEWAISAGREFFTPANLALVHILVGPNVNGRSLKGLTVDELLGV